MFIRNCITYITDLVILKDNCTVDDAIKIFKKYNLKSIPVTDGKGIFIGILSKEGLFELLENGEYQTFEELKNSTVTKAITKMTPLKLDSFF